MNNQEVGKVVYYSSESDDEDSSLSLNIFTFIRDFVSYFFFRVRQLYFFSSAAVISFLDIFSNIKSWSVRRMYWGRSSMYRSSFHVIVFTITLVSLFFSISQRINIFKTDNSNGLVLASGIIGNNDTLYQAGTTESITAVNPDEKNWPVYKHVVKPNETLTSISNLYGVSEATVKWANNLYSNKLKVDQELTVPGLNGVLYKVQKGDTVKSIANKTEGSIFDIVELNELQSENVALAEGQEIFIPNGVIVTPKVPVRGVGNYIKLADPGVKVEPGTFINPLSYCPGYMISRGVSAWHTGVDMAKPGGCWINASSAGVVEKAEWGSYGQGFYVQINHGNGFISYYYHGNGDFAVQKGQKVNAGQRILYMGTTGNSTGTHLHFELRYNGVIVDPKNYTAL